MLEFAVKVCREQLKGGRHFAFEHPLCATSWKIKALQQLRGMSGVTETVGHMCAYGMMSKDAFGDGEVFKATRFLTTSTAIQEMLSRKCSRNHRHVHLVDGRASKAAIYPKDLVDAILDGLKVEQSRVVHHAWEVELMMMQDGLHEEVEHGGYYIDNTSGKKLDKKKVEEARAEEMKTFEEMGVYEYARRCDIVGKIVGVRWVDVDKGSEIRSRLVAQEFAGKDDRDDLFAGTPPLTATRLIISDVASSKRTQKGEKKVMVLDVKRAFLYGNIEEDIFIELPPEDLLSQYGYVGKSSRLRTARGEHRSSGRRSSRR